MFYKSKLKTKLVLIIFLAIFAVSFFLTTFSIVEAQLNFKNGIYSYNFNRNLTVGSAGKDVNALQQFLNLHRAQISASGPGSPGNETTYFGISTKVALVKWQIANSISPANGYFGLKSRSSVMNILKGASLLPLLSTSPIFVPITSISNETSQSLVVKKSPEFTENIGLPVRIKIPSINIDAVIEHVGLTIDGSMDSPKGPDEVGWYNQGPRPGEIGSAVIDGHSGWKNGIPAVFDNLYKLEKGDKIYIESDTGVITTFVIRESRKYEPTSEASSVFISNDGKSHLNLITCTGTWDIIKKSRSNRLVVFADKILE